MESDPKPTVESTEAAPTPQESGSDDEEEYVVEKILKHRTTKKNTIEYFLKWKGFPSEENTWEPAENLNCPDLIEAYKKDQQDKSEKKKGKVSLKNVAENESKTNGIDSEEKKRKKKSTDDSAPTKKKKKSEKRLTGFDKDYEAEEILGATETQGEVHFLIKWKGANDAELVPARVANIKIPQMVIGFYEARLTWSNSSSKSSDDADGDEEASKGVENDEQPANPIDATAT